MTRELIKEFKRAERTFEMLQDNGTWYVYKVTFNKGKDTEYCTYEVFRRYIRKLSIYQLASNELKGYDDYVVYPSDNDFGKWAWSTNETHLQETINKLKKEGKIND